MNSKEKNDFIDEIKHKVIDTATRCNVYCEDDFVTPSLVPVNAVLKMLEDLK